jgi:hypothetical protein
LPVQLAASGTVPGRSSLNPLLGRTGYQPLAAGMQAALPWICLRTGPNLDSLLALEPEHESVSRGPKGRCHDR